MMHFPGRVQLLIILACVCLAPGNRPVATDFILVRPFWSTEGANVSAKGANASAEGAKLR